MFGSLVEHSHIEFCCPAWLEYNLNYIMSIRESFNLLSHTGLTIVRMFHRLEVEYDWQCWTGIECNGYLNHSLSSTWSKAHNFIYTKSTQICTPGICLYLYLWLGILLLMTNIGLANLHKIHIHTAGILRYHRFYSRAKHSPDRNRSNSKN